MQGRKQEKGRSQEGRKNSPGGQDQGGRRQEVWGRKGGRPTVVFFDLETTGFDRPIRPVQVCSCIYLMVSNC